MEAANSLRVDTLVQMVALYTEQIEKYETQNTTFALGSIAFLGAILGIIIGLIDFPKKDGRSVEILKYRMISFFILSIPIAMSLVLYTLSLNMQKVSLFRGYLSYLEETLNGLLGTNDMVLNNALIEEFIASNFQTNQWGWYGLAAFAIFAFFASSAGSLYFSKLAPGKRFQRWHRIIFTAVIIVCGVSCAVFAYDLATNNAVIGEVWQYCKELNAP